MKTLGPIVCMCLTMWSPGLIDAQVEQAPQFQNAKDDVPKETIELIAKARKVLEHFYAARQKALREQHKFETKEAWDEAAKSAGFDDQAAFDKAIGAQKKADAGHFPKLYSEMRSDVEKAHMNAVKADEQAATSAKK